MAWFSMPLASVVKVSSYGTLSALFYYPFRTQINFDTDNLYSSQDSLGVSVQTSKNLYSGRIGAHPSTILTLNHETIGITLLISVMRMLVLKRPILNFAETTAHQVLPYAIQQLKAAGYRLVTVAECLGKPAYQSVVAPSARDVRISFYPLGCLVSDLVSISSPPGTVNQFANWVSFYDDVGHFY